MMASSSNGGGEFLATLRTKAKRPSQISTPPQPANSPALPRKKNSIVQMTSNALLRKKSSLLGMLGRKPSDEALGKQMTDDTDSVEISPVPRALPNGNNHKVPPLSPMLTEASNEKRSSLIKTNDSTSSRTVHLQRSANPLAPRDGSSGSMRQSQSASSIPGTKDPLLAFPSHPRPGTTIERRTSRVVSHASEMELRERSPSVTSIDSVYGKFNRESPKFEMINPLLDGSSGSSGLPRNVSSRTSLVSAPSSSGIVDLEKAKRTSLCVSAASHVDQMKLLERRNTRTSTRMSATYSREAMSGGGGPSIPDRGYDRDAFSSPEASFPPLSPTITSKRAPSARNVSALSKESPGAPARRRSSVSSTASGSPSSGLRAKRANSKLLHDRANYSNTVLTEVQGLAENKLRKAELHLFLVEMRHSAPPVRNGNDRVDFLLHTYKIEDLAMALFKLYTRVPKGWDVYLTEDLQWKMRHMMAAQRVANMDQGKLTHNLKILMGEDTFVANDQVGKLHKLAQLQQHLGGDGPK